MNVDRDEITNVATIFESTADTIGYEGAAAARCTFDGPMAGRKYAASGAAIHRGVDKIAASLQNWESQSRGIGKAMRDGVTQYGHHDRQNAETLTAEP